MTSLTWILGSTSSSSSSAHTESSSQLLFPIRSILEKILQTFLLFSFSLSEKKAKVFSADNEGCWAAGSSDPTCLTFTQSALQSACSRRARRIYCADRSRGDRRVRKAPRPAAPKSTFSQRRTIATVADEIHKKKLISFEQQKHFRFGYLQNKSQASWRHGRSPPPDGFQDFFSKHCVCCCYIKRFKTKMKWLFNVRNF